MSFTPLTYSKLIEKQNHRVIIGELNPQTAANRVTALRTFLKANHLQEIDVVGSEMRLQFLAAIETMISALRELGKTDRNISNTRAALTSFRTVVLEDDNLRAMDNSLDWPFTTELKKVISDIPLKKIAKQSGVPPDMLRGWLHGKKPRVSSLISIRRLEAFFGIPRDSLVELSGIPTKLSLSEKVNKTTPIAYRVNLSVRNKDRYFLTVSENSIFRVQWAELLRYKTQPVPILSRSPGGRWTPSHLNVKQVTKASWWSFLDDLEIPSAKTTWAKIAGYIGWLFLSVEKGGCGFSYSEKETLAWIAVPGYIEQYTDWVKARSMGRHTGTIFEFFAMIAWMLRPGDGYLYQRPELQKTLPPEFQLVPWDVLCEKQFVFCKRLKNALIQEKQKGRNPFEPMNHIIELKEPLEVIADMVQRMRRDRPIGNTISEAIWARDLFLIKMLVTNPLRLRNIAALTWSPLNMNGRRPSDRCALYQRVDGSWWISIPKIFLKNRRGTAIRDYDSPIRKNVWEDLERYLFKHRPTLIRSPTEYVFLSRSKSNRKFVGNVTDEIRTDDIYVHKPFMELSKRVFDLTKKYLWNCPGIGTHGFRHIVATAILKTDDGNIKTAALVLNDRESTIEKHYSGIRSGDGSVRMGELLGKTLDRM